MSVFYPPVSFYFSLSFSGVSGQPEASFKEVSGISMEMGTEEIAEGGVNGYKHRVPTTAKFSNLVLKRGLVPKDSAVAKWCIDTITGELEDTIDTKNIVVSLLNENGQPLKTWSFVNAWPVKWAVSDFNSMNNDLVIETLEFSFSYFK
jgi:phage tail-like protein